MVSLKNNSVGASKHAVNGFSVDDVLGSAVLGKRRSVTVEMFSYLYTRLIQIHKCIPIHYLSARLPQEGVGIECVGSRRVCGEAAQFGTRFARMVGRGTLASKGEIPA
jgi:hypothetical protein